MQKGQYMFYKKIYQNNQSQPKKQNKNKIMKVNLFVVGP